MVHTESSDAPNGGDDNALPRPYHRMLLSGARGQSIGVPLRAGMAGMPYLMPAVSSSMAVVTDFGRSIANPRALSQVMLVSTPMALPTPNRTV